MEKNTFVEGGVDIKTITFIAGLLIAGYFGREYIGSIDTKSIYENIISYLPKQEQDISSSLEKIAQSCQQAGYRDITKCKFASAQAGNSAKDILIKNGFDEKDKNFLNFHQAFIKLNGLQGVSPVEGQVYILPNKFVSLKAENLSQLDFASAYNEFIKKCGIFKKCLISTPKNQDGAVEGLDDFLKSNGGWNSNIKSQSIHEIFQTLNGLKTPSLESGKYYMFASTGSLNLTEGKISTPKNIKPLPEVEKTQPEFVLIKAENSDTFYNLFRKAGYEDISEYNKFINSENKNFDPKNNIWVWNDIKDFDQNSKPVVGKEYKIKNLKAGQKINVNDQKSQNLEKIYSVAVDYIKQNKLDKYSLIDFSLFKKLAMRESSGSHIQNGQTIQTTNRVGTKSVGLTQMTPAAVEDVNKKFGTDFTMQDIISSEQKNVISSILYYSILAQTVPQVGDEDYKTSLILASYNGGAATVNAIYEQSSKPKNWDQMRNRMLVQMYGKQPDYKVAQDANGVGYRNFFTQNYDKTKQVIEFETLNGKRSWKADKFEEIIKYVEIINYPQKIS